MVAARQQRALRVGEQDHVGPGTIAVVGEHTDQGVGILGRHRAAKAEIGGQDGDVVAQLLAALVEQLPEYAQADVEFAAAAAQHVALDGAQDRHRGDELRDQHHGEHHQKQPTPETHGDRPPSPTSRKRCCSGEMRRSCGALARSSSATSRVVPASTRPSHHC